MKVTCYTCYLRNIFFTCIYLLILSSGLKECFLKEKTTNMAELTYLFKQDIIEFLDDKTLNELTGGRQAIGDNPAVAGDDKIWQDYLKTAIEKVKGYSRHWYDMDTEMRVYVEYADPDPFTEGQRVATVEDVDGNRTLYLCIQDAPGGTPLTNTDFYTLIDDRNPVILENTAIFVVYNLNRRQNPRQIPEQRQIDYENAISSLKDIQTGKIMLEIAERSDVESDDPGQQIAFGDFDDIPITTY